MSGDEAPVPPPVMWAQRPGVVFLTVCLEDCKDPVINIDTDKVYFKGVGGTERKLHEVTIPLYKEVDPDKSVTSVKARNIELVLKKKESSQGYWPHLCSDKQKRHWLKVDFNKWKDEDDSDDETGQPEDLEEMMRQMGGLGGGGGGDSKPVFDDLDAESDSDDEELPDLE